MKKLFLALTVVLLAACGGKKDNAFTISGTLPSFISADYMYLYTLTDDKVLLLDSAKVKNGQFSFSGVAPDTVMMAYIMHQPGVTDAIDIIPDWGTVFIEKGNIVADTDGFFAQGTPVNDGVSQWMSSIMEPSVMGLEELFLSKWQEHSSDYVGVYMLMQMSSMLDFKVVDSLAAQIPDSLVQCYSALRSFKSYLNTYCATQPGNKYVDCEFADLNGNAVKLSDFLTDGNWLLVDFWASHCGPCLEAIPEIQKAIKSLKNVNVVGVVVNDRVSDVRKVMETLRVTWPVLLDSDGHSARAYGVNAIPDLILIAPDGTITARRFIPSELPSLIR